MANALSSRIVPFPGAITALLDKVGGKGQALIRMTQIGMPVPPGFVLTVDFFTPWLDELKLSQEWKEFTKSTTDSLKEACDALKSSAIQLDFTDEQRELLEPFLDGLSKDRLIAVRSSSPAEDLEGTSFAGAYESILGCNRETVAAAIKQCFASCLDFRIVAYKLKIGMDIGRPAIAVIVQEQLNSTISGVAFSINPLTNDFDQAVFNANWGLGETVVSGECTPDTIVVDKYSMRVVERVLGDKETRITLKDGGGTERIDEVSDNEFCIGDGHVLSLTRQVKTLEEVFRCPVDVEWAIEGDIEYILQARPITSYVPLAPELYTAPGAKRKVYCDVTLSIQGIEKPLSKMGLSLIERIGKKATSKNVGDRYISDHAPAMVLFTGGRIYLTISHMLQLTSKANIANFARIMDPQLAKIIEELDEKKYKSHALWVPLIPLRAIPSMFRRMPSTIGARMFPARAHERIQRKMIKYKESLRKDAQSRSAPHKVAEKIIERALKFVMEVTLPAMIASRWALERMKATARDAPESLVADLEIAMPHNVTVEMGLDLYRLAQELKDDAPTLWKAKADEMLGAERNPTEKNGSETTVNQRVKDRAKTNSGSLSDEIRDKQSPEDFFTPAGAAAWTRFMDDYGHRGPGELDIASPRYRDDPSLLYNQVSTLKRSTTSEQNPSVRYEKNREQREKAYEEICNFLAEKKDESSLRRFKSLYRVWTDLGGYREIHKYCLILAIDSIRQRLLTEARELVKKGRLDKVERIFDLSYSDLEKRLFGKKTDLVELALDNRKFTDKLAKVPRLPTVIDSRGKIIQPKRTKAKEGEIPGTPISNGVARGPVKVLHSPDEKQLEHGDILVARATDPGWTPLFVNAGAVILEIGGLLQHGALVAREYGLPCVGGVNQATSLFEDGTIVEVDGTSGLIRIVETAGSKS